MLDDEWECPDEIGIVHFSIGRLVVYPHVWHEIVNQAETTDRLFYYSFQDIYGSPVCVWLDSFDGGYLTTNLSWSREIKSKEQNAKFEKDVIKSVGTRLPWEDKDE